MVTLCFILDYVRPICLPFEDVIGEAYIVKDSLNSDFTQKWNLTYVAGWGVTEQGQAADILQFLNITVFDSQKCKAGMLSPSW